MLFGVIPQNLLELAVALLYRPYGMGDRSAVATGAGPDAVAVGDSADHLASNVRPQC